MERYLSRSPQAGWLDAVGLRLGILAGCEVWFFALWGVGLPAILAGGALAAMIFLALRLLKKRRVVRKEQALRRRIGGELALEELLLAPAKKAHFQVALLVSAKWPVVLLRVTEDGMLCRYGTETLLGLPAWPCHRKNRAGAGASAGSAAHLPAGTGRIVALCASRVSVPRQPKSMRRITFSPCA